MRAEFHVFVGNDQQYCFNLHAGNNKIILRSSEGYSTKQAALNGIESIRENSQFDNRYQRFMSTNNEPMFRLVATNGKIIGVSESYSSKQQMENGIESVKENALTATINYHEADLPNMVVISIKGKEYSIKRGSHLVSEIKQIGNISNGHTLVLIEGTKLTPLSDDARITIKGGEIFDCTPKSGADS